GDGGVAVCLRTVVKAARTGAPTPGHAPHGGDYRSISRRNSRRTHRCRPAHVTGRGVGPGDRSGSARRVVAADDAETSSGTSPRRGPAGPRGAAVRTL